jgi:hypothetical protein
MAPLLPPLVAALIALPPALGNLPAGRQAHLDLMYPLRRLFYWFIVNQGVLNIESWLRIAGIGLCIDRGNKKCKSQKGPSIPNYNSTTANQKLIAVRDFPQKVVLHPLDKKPSFRDYGGLCAAGAFWEDFSILR